MRTKKSELLQRRLIFLGLLIFGAASIVHVGFIESHWDEDACMSIGWLLSKGWRLYGDVFSHHMPLDYLPSWAVASAFGPHVAAFRGFMIALWAAACSGLYFAFLERETKELDLAPLFFAALSAQWLTYWMGQMMLVESYWGYALVVLLAIIGGPLGLKARPTNGNALLVGALMGILLSASLICALPFACLLLWLAGDSPWRRRWKALLGGFAGWLALFGLWCARHADMSQWAVQAVWFNVNIYSRFHPFKTSNPYLGFLLDSLHANAAYFGSALRWTNRAPLEQYFESLLKIAALGWIAWRLRERKFLQAVWWVLFILSVRSRTERFADAPPFHSAPFYLLACLLVSVELSRLWRWIQLKQDSRWSLGAAMLAALVLAPTLAATSLTTDSLRPYAKQNVKYKALLDAIRRCSRPDDRLSVFPCYPRLYLDSERFPAAPNVFYLPWQAAWEPQHTATLQSLEASRPKLIVTQNTAIWNIPWQVYGRDVEALIQSRYVPVMADQELNNDFPVQLYVRRGDAVSFARCASK